MFLAYISNNTEINKGTNPQMGGTLKMLLQN